MPFRHRTSFILLMICGVFSVPALADQQPQETRTVNPVGVHELMRLLPEAEGSNGQGSKYGYQVEVDGNLAVVSAPGEAFGGVVYAYHWVDNQWQYLTALRAENIHGFRDFGHAISLSGNTLAVGVPNLFSSNSGKVFIYEFSVGTWALQQVLAADGETARNGFGHSVSLADNQLLVGGHFESTTDTFSGAVYAFSLNGNVWSQQQKLIASDGVESGYFGYAVDHDGQWAMVSAPGGSSQGGPLIYVLYQSASLGWLEFDQLQPADISPGDRLGFQVSIQGNQAVFGAAGNDDAGVNTGSALVYELNGFDWTLLQHITAPDAVDWDGFGYDVLIEDSLMFISAQAYDDWPHSYDSQAVYVYEVGAQGWEFQTKLTSADTAAGDAFGFAVGYSQNRMLVGAIDDDTNGNSSGAVYAFENAGSWQQTDVIIPLKGAWQESFGHAVSIDGDTMMIATRNQDSSYNEGAVKVYRLLNQQWQLVQTLTASDSPSVQQFGNNISLNGDVVAIASVDSDISQSGTVYIFRHDGNQWVETQTLTSGIGWDDYAQAIHLSAAGLLVSAATDNDMGGSSGAVYFYENNSGTFSFSQKFYASDGSTNDNFGQDISVDQQRAIISSGFDFSPGGDAYVFELTGGEWQEMQKLSHSEFAVTRYFASSVSISGDLVVVGDKGHGNTAGRVHIYRFENGSWRHKQRLYASDSEQGKDFGDRVMAMSDDVVVVGASAFSSLGQGSAYVFGYTEGAFHEVSKLAPTAINDDNRFSQSMSFSGDLMLLGSEAEDELGNGSGAAYLYQLMGDLIYQDGFNL